VSLVAVMVYPMIFPASSVGLHFREGMSSVYVYGSCTYYQFSIGKPAIVTGAFTTNGSATMLVTFGAGSYPSSDGCLGIPAPYYSTGSVRQAYVNFSLAPGTYVLAFAFTNQSSSTTSLSITKGFIARYTPTFVDQGPTCVSISCYQHDLGPSGPNGQS